ncbi:MULTISPECIES: TetR/AcrR family transcriptional regulator [unclassified Sphingomonas]|uniref:TetR/AcrR family transcriptional regulator n=1 Tax=unclassified Sphingomonas TaxID=196159 RepID=UPI002269A743|nr:MULTISPECIES: TetR/AcrR family transcriptional regulator [unclassified Sphingomonas]
MGRAISFDLDRALDAAMREFWKGGYAGTSLQDLLRATGVGAGSFYNTLKSKKHLFLESLRRYGKVEVAKRLDALVAAPTTGAGLRAMYRVAFDGLDDPATPSRLCMMAGMVTPDVLDDPDMRAIVEKGQDRFRNTLIELIERDQENGILPATIDAAVTAAIVATYGQGMIRTGLVDYDRKRMERETEAFLVALGL